MKTAKGFPGETFVLANINLSSLDNFVILANHSHFVLLLLVVSGVYSIMAAFLVSYSFDFDK